MKFLILLCVLVPLCAGDWQADGDDWLGQDLDERIDSIRVRRQVPQGAKRLQGPPQEPQYQYRPYNQAPSQIKQLLQIQQQRSPVIPVPSQPAPNLGGGHSQQAQAQAQPQVQGGYRPNVQYGKQPQQPTYQNQAAQYQPQAQRQQYQPQGQPQYNQQG